jgi:hypothetical protein
MNIKEKKERISDVMAIYIVQPTEENFKIIKNDLEKRIFDNFFINFVERADDSKFQSFFSDLISTDNYNRIYKISVNPFGYLMYHPRVFTCGSPSPYFFLNAPSTSEQQIEKYFIQVGTSIFNTLFNTRTIPLIKYRTGWFAENIVSIIQENFTQAFEKFPEIKEEFLRKNSTLLLIVDRDTDLPIMFHHGASLGCMYNDIFGISRTKSTSKYEIDPIFDHIWEAYLTTNFVDAKSKVLEEIKQITDQTDFLDDVKKNQGGDIEKISEKLASTLEGLRDLSIRQSVLKNHLTFQDKLKTEIDRRDLGMFYGLEESILKKRIITGELKQNFRDMISLKSFKPQDIELTRIDLLRLSLLYYMINTKISNDEIREIEKFLQNSGCNIDSLEYLKQKKAFEEGISQKGKQQTQEGGNWLFQKGKSYFMDKVGSYLTNDQPSVVADIANNLCSGKEVANFVSYNLIKKSVEKQNVNQTFNQIIVFAVGGGSLSEFEYLDELLVKNGRNVIIIK